MADTDRLSKAALDSIAKQVGQLLPQFASDAEVLRQPAELAETFAIWMLPADKVIGGSDELSDLAANTGRWHSQIRSGGKSKTAARSISLGGDPENWQVRQIVEGRLAEDIDAEIDWLDEQIPDDGTVRLLDIPAFHLSVFWIHSPGEDSRVVVALLPKNAQFLKKQTVYTSTEFLCELRREQFVVGFQPQ